MDKQDLKINQLYIMPNLIGKGKVWFDKFNIYIDGKEERENLNLVVPAKESINWLKKNLIPLSSSSPNTPHEKNLYQLKSFFQSAKILALGECTHGSQEIFQMKHRLIKFLVEEMSITLFAMEENMANADKINKYIQTGKGDPKKLFSCKDMWKWDTQEIIDLLEWMKQYNQKNQRKVTFTCFDMQRDDISVLELKEFAKVQDKELITKLEKYENTSKSLSQERNVNSLISLAKDIYKHLTENKSKYTETISTKRHAQLVQRARLLVQYANLQNRPDYSLRDSYMAKNIN